MFEFNRPVRAGRLSAALQGAVVFSGRANGWYVGQVAKVKLPEFAVAEVAPSRTCMIESLCNDGAE